MLTKEKEEGSKSAYLEHLGGYFAFVAFAGISLIGWGLNHYCWRNKFCCFKEFHNPQNINVFWWMSFIGLCGIFACCISGFITSRSFGNKVGAAKCAYERIYYDSNYGEIKKSEKKWEGLKNKQKLVGDFKSFVEDNKTTKIEIFNEAKIENDSEKWYNGSEYCKEYYICCLEKDSLYRYDLIKLLNDSILRFCRNATQDLYDKDNNLVCDRHLKREDSIVMNYIKKVTNVSKSFTNEVLKINEFVDNKKSEKKTWNNQINMIETDLTSISEDLNNYQDVFLDKAYYYIKLSNIFGKILVIVFYSILIAIVVISCFLLWAYTYFRDQKLIYIFMHIAWNILKFFAFSFFLFGTAFGAFYLISRDLIGYNEFIFSNSNLNENVIPSLLPGGDAKEYLRYCINEEDTNYVNNLKTNITNIMRDLYYNMLEGQEIKDKYNFSDMQQPVLSGAFGDVKIRNIEETDVPDEEPSDIPQPLVFLNFTEVSIKLEKIINDLYEILFSIPKFPTRNLQSGGTNLYDLMNQLNETLGKLNCGFVKNEVQIIYDSLYELSIESRISCALCCCIGFFAEFSIVFFLLVLYHYNNVEFKEEIESQKSFKKSRNRKMRFDMDSQNEFMDKTRPANMKNKNKQLDLDFNFN